MSRDGAIIGVSDHGGWAVLVTIAVRAPVEIGSPLKLRRLAGRQSPLPKSRAESRDLLSGITLLDRRRVELVDADLPKIPHHSECQRLPIDQAVALVERVRVSAERHARLALEAVATTLSTRGVNIVGIALRLCPELPATIAERIKDYRAHNVADWVMYREALAAAAEARGWAVHWYQTKSVFHAARLALGINDDDLDAHFLQLKRSIGPPWNQDHKLAMAAAIVASRA